jgi:hypothetical protein
MIMAKTSGYWKFDNDKWDKTLIKFQQQHNAGYKEGMLRKKLLLVAGKKRVY